MNQSDISNNHLSCLCCRGKNLTVESTLTSLFLSRAAWEGPPEITDLLYCNDCGFRIYRRHLSDTEAKKYYSDYRGKRYVAERSRDEIFYNQSVYDRDEAWMASPRRQKEMLNFISQIMAEYKARSEPDLLLSVASAWVRQLRAPCPTGRG